MNDLFVDLVGVPELAKVDALCGTDELHLRCMRGRIIKRYQHAAR